MLFGRLVPMPAVCPCSDFTLLLGTILPLGVDLAKFTCCQDLVLEQVEGEAGVVAEAEVWSNLLNSDQMVQFSLVGELAAVMVLEYSSVMVEGYSCVEGLGCS